MGKNLWIVRDRATITYRLFRIYLPATGAFRAYTLVFNLKKRLIGSGISPGVDTHRGLDYIASFGAKSQRCFHILLGLAPNGDTERQFILPLSGPVLQVILYFYLYYQLVNIV